jgi:hypothetical protein
MRELDFCIMKSSLIAISFFCLALLSPALLAHNSPARVIKGVVLDGTSGESLTGVRVTLSNGQVAITDENGFFQFITHPDVAGDLRFDLVAFQSKMMPIHLIEESGCVHLFEFP